MQIALPSRESHRVIDPQWCSLLRVMRCPASHHSREFRRQTVDAAFRDGKGFGQNPRRGTRADSTYRVNRRKADSWYAFESTRRIERSGRDTRRTGESE
jgi:hypothetical protein